MQRGVANAGSTAMRFSSLLLSTLPKCRPGNRACVRSPGRSEKRPLDAKLVQARRPKGRMLFQRIIERKSSAPKCRKSAAKAPFATFMQPLCDFPHSASKLASVTTQTHQRGTLTQPFHCDQQKYAQATQIATPKPDLDAQADNRQFHSARAVRHRFDGKATTQATVVQKRAKAFLRNGSSVFHVYPKQHNRLKILTFNPHP